MGKKYVRIQELEPERQKKSKVIAVMNNKGGCGKTSTAMALGMYLARTGNNILFWDGDPQSNLTQRLGIPDDLTIKRINMLMKNPEDNEDITQIMEYPYLQRVPGTKNSVGAVGLIPGDHMSETEAKNLHTKFLEYQRQTEKIVGHSSLVNYVQNLFDEKRKYFDYIILDTAPALQGNTLNVVALNTAEEIICPIDSLEAMAGIDEILGWMSSQTRFKKVKPNGLFAMVKYQTDTKEFDYSGETRSNNAVFRSMKKVFKDFVCNHGVKELKSMRLSKKSIPGFGGKTEYTALCKEIIEKISRPDRKNVFDYVEENGAIRSLESEIATLSKMIVKRKPHRKIPQYVITKNVDIVGVEDESIRATKTV